MMQKTMYPAQCMRPAPMTAAQHAFLRRIHRADQGLGVLLPMANRLTIHAFTRLWIAPTPRPWCRSKSEIRFKLTSAGRRVMLSHEAVGQMIRRLPRRRLPKA